MIDDNQVNIRVLRKRKIPLETDVNVNDTVSNKVDYNVLIEHNYFRAVDKKSCRWPDIKNAYKDSSVTLLETNTSYSEDCYKLPDYLKGFKSTSDEECEDDDDDDDDDEVKPLSLLLKIELENDLKAKKLKATHASKINTTLQKFYPDIKIRNYGFVKNNSEKNSKVDNYHPHSIVSEGLISGVSDYSSIGVETPEITVHNTSMCSINTSIPKNKNINEFQTISESSNNSSFKKLSVENIFTCDILSNDLLMNKKNAVKNSTKNAVENSIINAAKDSIVDLVDDSDDDTVEDSIEDAVEDSVEDSTSDTVEDSIENSQNDSLNSPSACNNDITESSKSSEENLEFLDRSLISSLLPENISPPFEWYHIIYLAMKNSTNEYVTSQEIQHFSRHWFPFYNKKSWIGVIISTLKCFKNKFFVSFSFSTTFDDWTVWTVKEKSVEFLEFQLLSVVEQFENAIKSSMKNPDQLPLLLKGYGVCNLGYANK